MKRDLVVAMAGLSLTLLGCRENTGQKITMGAMLSVTGGLAEYGSAQAKGAQLAVEEINANGGVLGASLELLVKDDGSDANAGASVAQQFVDAKVPVVVGASGSGITLNAIPVLSGAKIPEIATSATAPALTHVADDGYLFRTCPSDAFQATVLGSRAYKKGFTRVAIVHIPGPYGEGQATAFQDAFQARGGTITLNQEFAENQPSYTSLLSAVYATTPQAIFLVGYTSSAAQIIKDYNTSFSDRGTFWFFMEAVAQQAFIDDVGAGGFSFGHEGAIPSAPSSPYFAGFASKYQARYNESIDPVLYAQNAFDAVYLAALAMEAAGKAEGTAVRDNLTAVSETGTTFDPSTYKQALDALHSGGDINFDGASGTVDLDSYGDVPGSGADIWRVQSGSISVVETNVTP